MVLGRLHINGINPDAKLGHGQEDSAEEIRGATGFDTFTMPRSLAAADITGRDMSA